MPILVAQCLRQLISDFHHYENNGKKPQTLRLSQSYLERLRHVVPCYAGDRLYCATNDGFTDTARIITRWPSYTLSNVQHLVHQSTFGKGVCMAVLGYGRVSTVEQTLDLQRDALEAAGATSVYEDKASGKTADRPELVHCLKALRHGDTLVVWRLDRLGRNLQDLIRIVNALALMKDRELSITEIARQFGVSRSTLYNIQATSKNTN